MKELACVFIGGGLGSVGRYMISMVWRHLSLNPRYADIVFPWPTFVVNILGCLLIGIFYEYSERWGMTPEMRLFLTTGLCGGFTTFSTFSYESMTLMHTGDLSLCALYVIGSILLGVIAVFLPTIISHV